MPRMRIVLSLAAALAAPAAAAWEVEPRFRVTAEPVETTGAIESVVIRCRPELVIGLVTPSLRIRPDRDFAEEEALFSEVFGKAVARVDGETFALGAVGAADEATAYLFPRRPLEFLSALHEASSLEIGLDIVPETARDGAGFETIARFDGEGLADALGEAGRACSEPPSAG